MDLTPYLIPYTKFNLRRIVSLNPKARIKKLLEENIRECLCFLQIGRDFLGVGGEAAKNTNWERKENDKLDFVRIKY